MRGCPVSCMLKSFETLFFDAAAAFRSSQGFLELKMRFAYPVKMCLLKCRNPSEDLEAAATWKNNFSKLFNTQLTGHPPGSRQLPRLQVLRVRDLLYVARCGEGCVWWLPWSSLSIKMFVFYPVKMCVLKPTERAITKGGKPEPPPTATTGMLHSKAPGLQATGNAP